MPVSGLVVSFTDQPDLAAKAVDAIRDEPRIEIGVTDSRRMAIVIDTATSDDDKQLWNWLQGLPGVAFVDLVMVGFEDSTASGSSLSSG